MNLDGNIQPYVRRGYLEGVQFGADLNKKNDLFLHVTYDLFLNLTK